MLKINNVSKRFDDVVAVKNVNFKRNKGINFFVKCCEKYLRNS